MRCFVGDMELLVFWLCSGHLVLLPWASFERCAWFLLQAKLEVQKLINKAQDGALEAQPGRSIMESFEAQVSLPECVQLHMMSFQQLSASSACSSRIGCVARMSSGAL